MHVQNMWALQMIQCRQENLQCSVTMMIKPMKEIIVLFIYVKLIDHEAKSVSYKLVHHLNYRRLIRYSVISPNIS